MHHDKLGPLLLTRLRATELDTDLVKDFVGAKREAVQLWRRTDKYPRGERLNKLWHLLATAGVESPELDTLPEFGKYLGQLLAFDIIPMTDATQVCNVTNAQAVFDVVRGEREPSHPQCTLQELRDLYNTPLQQAITKLKEQLSDTPAPTTPQPSSFMLKLPADARPETPVKSDQGSEYNQRLVLNLAQQLGGIIPLVNHLLSDECTNEERARLRSLLGDDTMFALSTAFNRLCSTRAFNQGR